jgi:hypothetical protein
MTTADAGFALALLPALGVFAFFAVMMLVVRLTNKL